MKSQDENLCEIVAMAGLGPPFCRCQCAWLGTQNAYAFYQSSGIPLFGTDLRGVGPGGNPRSPA